MTYSKEDCIKALKEIRNEIEQPLSSDKYRDNKYEYNPPLNTIVDLFGSWHSAKKQADLKESKSSKEKYTKKDCIQAIKNVSNKLGEPPSVKQYKKYRADNSPSIGPIIEKFGKWTNAKEKSNIGFTNKNYSKEECINSLINVAKKIGEAPSENEYNKHRDEDSPNSRDLINNFGNWNNTKEEAGLSGFSEQECLNSLRRIAENIGESPTIKQYKKQRYYNEPKSYFIRKKFETWNKAKKEADLKSFGNSDYTKSECIKAIKRVSNRLNKSPSLKEYTKYKNKSEPDIHEIKYMFDRWSKAKKKSGLNYVRRDYTKSECIKAIQKVSKKIDNESLSRPQYSENKSDSAPSTRIMRKKFGTWNNAKKEAGFHIKRSEYAKEECVNALNIVSNRINKSPTQNEYKKHKPSWAPSYSTIGVKFGTWDDAKEAAGLDTIGRNSYTKEECIDSLIRVSNETEEPVLSPDIYNNNKIEGEPSSKEIRYWFGTWVNAKNKANLKISNCSTEFSEQECIEALKSVKNIADAPLTGSIYMESKSDTHPSKHTIADKIGSWNKAKKEAGLDIIKSNYSEEECIEALNYVADELGYSPSQSQYSNTKPVWAPSTSFMDYKFKNWNEAKKMANLSIFKNDGDNINYPYGSNWRTQRRKTLERDNYNCVLCGMSNESHITNNNRGLDVHHIYKLRKFYDLLTENHIKLLKSDKDCSKLHSKVKNITNKANHISNLVSLCRNCHLEKIEKKPPQKQIKILNITRPKFEP